MFISFANAALYDGSTDLLNGAGGFEFGGGAGPWTLFADGGETIGISTTMIHSGTYALKTGPAVSSSRNWRATVKEIATVANREHKVVTYSGYKGSSPSWARAALGQSGYVLSMAVSSTTYLKLATNYYTTGATENLVDFALAVYSNSANDTVYIDDVALYREIALPKVDAITGSGAAWRFTNIGGRTGDTLQLVAFDPDATVSYVSGFNVGNIAVTWSSDNQLMLSFENSLVGAVDLMVTNPNGNASYLVTIPEPATIAILGIGALAMVRSKKK
jgi:hypothetical protein